LERLVGRVSEPAVALEIPSGRLKRDLQPAHALRLADMVGASQEQSIDYAEHRRVHADAERQRDDDRRAERRLTQDATKAEAHVTPGVEEPHARPPRTAGLCGQARDRPSGGGSGSAGRSKSGHDVARCDGRGPESGPDARQPGAADVVGDVVQDVRLKLAPERAWMEQQEHPHGSAASRDEDREHDGRHRRQGRDRDEA
jgi:hypothetical protein